MHQLSLAAIPLAAIMLMVYKLLRLPLDASLKQRADARRWVRNLLLAVAYVGLFLAAMLAVFWMTSLIVVPP
jgi:hypothetical protein